MKIKFLDGTEKELETLKGANLGGANLEGADLGSANLRGANLQSAYLRHANLEGADLARADLEGADLEGADLRGAYLRDAYLRDANLAHANLKGANLYRAYLYHANLRGANLRGANLEGADLRGADLRGADLTDVDLSEFQILPEKGFFRGYKKIVANSGYKVIEIEIAASARRVSTPGQRKCRAERVRVIPGQLKEPGWSMWDENFVYPIAGEVSVKNFDSDIRVVCAPGIHFFLTRAEAERYT